MVVTEFVDDDEIRSYQATLGEEATIELTREKWLTLTNGTHQLRVEAVDGNFATSVRVWNFSKAENTIAFQFSAPEETDARATKILITPTWKIEAQSQRWRLATTHLTPFPHGKTSRRWCSSTESLTSPTRPRRRTSGA